MNIALNEKLIREACATNQRNNEAIFPALKGVSSTNEIDVILSEIQRIAELPMEQSTTLPKEAYTSEAFFSWEIENIFRKEWLCLAHVSQIPNAGDFINLDLLGEPLIVIRDKSSKVRVLSRVCPHRAMDIMPPEFGYEGFGTADWKDGKPGCGNTRLFICPYHSWTFELDGRLKACPEMQEADGFHRDEWGLREFRSEEWNGFIFVNLDGEAPRSVAEQYQGLGNHIGKWKIQDMSIVVENSWECPCNWKVLVENFMESYHHAGAHAKTLQPLMPARGTWTEAENPHFIRCHLPYKSKVRDEIKAREAEGQQWDVFPPIPGLEGEDRLEWGLMLGLPLFTFLVAPDQVVWYRIEPIGPDKLKVLTTVLVPKDVKAHPHFEQMLERGAADAVTFHLEDMEVVTAVQRSLYSKGYQRGRLSHLEMPIWLIQRYFAARARGTWPTMDRPGSPGQSPVPLD